jgi:hypothetical protein
MNQRVKKEIYEGTPKIQVQKWHCKWNLLLVTELVAAMK